MTEDVKKEEKKDETPPKLTEVEERALEMGWRPKEDWDGDPEEFVEAKEYVARKPLFDKIQSMGRSLKQTNQALEAMKNHYTKVRETEYNRALKQLQKERAEAVANADGETFEKLDTEIKSIEKEAAEIKLAAQTPLVQEQPAEHPVFVNWKNKNRWYETTGYMKAFADDLGVKLARQGMTPEEVLKEVEKAVHKEFPQKFTNSNKVGAPDVDTSRGSSRSNKSPEDDLTPQERNIMETLVKGGHITKEKYLADLKSVKERK